MRRSQMNAIFVISKTFSISGEIENRNVSEISANRECFLECKCSLHPWTSHDIVKKHITVQ